SSCTDFGKVATAHGGTRNACLQCRRLSVAESFVIDEEKRLVLSDGSTDITTKLVKATGGHRDARSVFQPVIASKDLVPQEQKATHGKACDRERVTFLTALQPLKPVVSALKLF